MVMNVGIAVTILPTQHPSASRPRQSGATLLEASAALALSAMAALAVLGGLRPLSCAFRVEAARSTLIDALLEARRAAYETEAGTAVETHVGSGTVVVQPSGSRKCSVTASR